jgi:hypothetical protein
VVANVPLQDGLQKRGGAAGGVLGDLFGGALGDEVAAFGAGFGADVDEVFYVGHVEADGGFFDEVEVAFGVLEAAQAFGGGAVVGS